MGAQTLPILNGGGCSDSRRFCNAPASRTRFAVRDIPSTVNGPQAWTPPRRVAAAIERMIRRGPSPNRSGNSPSTRAVRATEDAQAQPTFVGNKQVHGLPPRSARRD